MREEGLVCGGKEDGWGGMGLRTTCTGEKLALDDFHGVEPPHCLWL